MLDGAKLLEFIDETTSGNFLLLTIPPVERITLDDVNALKLLGVPLWHGSGYLMEEAWGLFTFWCRAYKRVHNKHYTSKRLSREVLSLKALASYVPAERISDQMMLFLTKKLDLERYADYRMFGPTLTTFCALYPRLAEQWRKLTRAERDEDDQVLALRRKMKAAKRFRKHASHSRNDLKITGLARRPENR